MSVQEFIKTKDMGLMEFFLKRGFTLFIGENSFKAIKIKKDRK